MIIGKTQKKAKECLRIGIEGFEGLLGDYGTAQCDLLRTWSNDREPFLSMWVEKVDMQEIDLQNLNEWPTPPPWFAITSKSPFACFVPRSIGTIGVTNPAYPSPPGTHRH